MIMESRESLRKKFKAFYWGVIFLYILGITGYFFDSLHELNSLKNSFGKYLSTIYVKEERIFQIRSALTRKGKDFSYKDTRKGARQKSREALDAVDDLLKDSSTTKKERELLKVIKETLKLYAQKLERDGKVFYKGKDGGGEREREKMIPLDDAPALRAIERLEKDNRKSHLEVHRVFYKKVGRLKRILIGVTSFGVLFFMTLFVYGYRRLKVLQDRYDRERQDRIHQARLSELQEMTGTLAHEINNPLTVIRAGAASLRKKLEGIGDTENSSSNETLLKRCDLIISTVDRIASIVDGLKKLSYRSEDKSEAFFLLNTVIDDICQISRDKFSHGGILFEVDVRENFLLEGHENQISQIIINLLNNSYDAVQNSEDRWIRLIVERASHEQEGYCTLRVIDSGPKLTKKEEELLMTPFYTTKPVGKGTGIGLSISKMIAQKHRGKLEYVVSEHTTFSLTLPFIKIVSEGEDS